LKFSEYHWPDEAFWISVWQGGGGGVPHHEDLWICGERVGPWWRREGHRVHPEDLAEILEFSPEVVIIGTGFSGMLKVTKEAEALLSSRGIELRALPTKEAVELYNELATEKTGGRAFTSHLLKWRNRKGGG